MIVNSIDTFKKYIPSAVNVSYEMVEDALMMAQEWLCNHITSDAVIQEIKNGEDEKLLEMAERAISTLAFYNCIPEIDLVLTEAGFAVVSSDNYTPASKQRVEQLRASMKVKSRKAIDLLVTYMNTNTESWRGSEQYQNITKAFVCTIEEFKRRGGNLSDDTDWEQFEEIIAKMSLYLHTQVAAYISEEYIQELLEKYRDKESIVSPEKNVLELIEDALCISTHSEESAHTRIMCALAMMRRETESFPTWAASEQAKGYTPDRSKSNVYSML